VKSAAQLGIAAKKLGVKSTAKTHKGRKILENKAAKIIENLKRSVIIKGRKSSEMINSLLHNLQTMRGTGNSQLLMRKSHDIAAMDDASLIEKLANNYDCSLFAVGSHQKKRPNNLVLGRNFDGHVLDMFEFGVDGYRGPLDFKPPADFTQDLKPILVF